MFEFLRSLGLEPLDWDKLLAATGEASPYIGDVLAAGFPMAQAVVVLLTPDDEARVRPAFADRRDPPHELRSPHKLVRTSCSRLAWRLRSTPRARSSWSWAS